MQSKFKAGFKKSVRVKALILTLIFAMALVLPITQAAETDYDAPATVTEAEYYSPSPEAPVAPETPGVSEGEGPEVPEIPEAPGADEGSEAPGETPDAGDPTLPGNGPEAPGEGGPAEGGEEGNENNGVPVTISLTVVNPDGSTTPINVTVPLDDLTPAAHNHFRINSGTVLSGNTFADGLLIAIVNGVLDHPDTVTTFNADTGMLSGTLNEYVPAAAEYVTFDITVYNPDGSVLPINVTVPMEDLTPAAHNYFRINAGTVLSGNAFADGLLIAIVNGVLDNPDTVATFDPITGILTAILDEYVPAPDLVTLRTVWVGFPEGMTHTELERTFERADLVWCNDADSFIGTVGSTFDFNLVNAIINGILGVGSTDPDVYTLTVTNEYDGDGNWTITVTRADVVIEPPTLRAYFYNVGADATTRVAYLPPVEFSGETTPTIADITFPEGVPAQGWVFGSYDVEQDADGNWVITVNFVPAPVIPGYTPCEICGYYPCECPEPVVYCPYCGEYPCECIELAEYCPDCGEYPCECEETEVLEQETAADNRRAATGPKTGDDSNSSFFAQIAAMALLVVIAATAGLIRTRKQD